jgi:carbon-monoxide dehydrogenase medium subunit
VSTVPFVFRTPATLEEALADLRAYGDDARPIAGGTALVILMGQRLVQPTCLISLRRIAGLDRVAAADGAIEIGACATHRDVETAPLVRERLPALAETFAQVATIRIRNMATVGGALAHADPNQDPLVTLLALDARARVAGPRGERQIPLAEFFRGYYETALAPGELVTGVSVPLPAPRMGVVYFKFLPRTADDYATVSAAASVTLDEAGERCTDLRIALGCIGPTPLRIREAEGLLRGQPLGEVLLREAGEIARRAADPLTDHRGSAAYKRDMAAVFTRRAVRAAWGRARQIREA